MDPESTVTEDGTDNAAELSDSDTETFPTAAAPNATVQLDVPLLFKEVGLQLKELRVAGGMVAVIVPPEPLTLRFPPVTELPRVSDRPIEVLLTVEAIVTETAATTPLGIAVLLNPARMQK